MIYLDNNATTQPSPLVVEAMLPYLKDCFYNPASTNTAFTGADKPRLQAANSMVQLLNAEDPECFVFTSGATESNNWVFDDIRQKGDRGRIVISSIEHASVLEPALLLRDYGFEVREVPVNREGVVVLDELSNALSDNTLLVSIMAANNETGVLQPIDKIGELVRERAPAAHFHTDATQAIGKIPINLIDLWPEIDLLSFSAHKFHGPKGIGGIYIRPGTELLPFLRGGGQESGLRAGTTNTAGLAGLAAAATEAQTTSSTHISLLRKEFESAIVKKIPTTIIHSSNVSRLPNTSCFSLPGIRAKDIAELLASRDIIIGMGSACSSGALHPPKTLLRMGVDYSIAWAALRLSLSRENTCSQLDEFLDALLEIIA